MTEGILTYSVRPGSALDDAEWGEVSELFSSAYGVYSDKEPSGRAGRRIRLSPGYYRRSYASDDYRVAFCRDGGRLVAEGVYSVCGAAGGGRGVSPPRNSEYAFACDMGLLGFQLLGNCDI